MSAALSDWMEGRVFGAFVGTMNQVTASRQGLIDFQSQAYCIATSAYDLKGQATGITMQTWQRHRQRSTALLALLVTALLCMDQSSDEDSQSDGHRSHQYLNA